MPAAWKARARERAAERWEGDVPVEAPQLGRCGVSTGRCVGMVGSGVDTYNTQTMGGFLLAVGSGVLFPFCAIISLCARSLSTAIVVVVVVMFLFLVVCCSR